MQCPKCQAAMEPVILHGIEVDRCTHCRGLWFDDREPEQLRERGGPESAAQLDIGEESVGREMNRKDRISCPRCQARMLRMVVPDQHHIWIESCPSCQGSFYDAGEFRDYADHSIFDLVRDWFTKARR